MNDETQANDETKKNDETQKDKLFSNGECLYEWTWVDPTANPPTGIWQETDNCDGVNCVCPGNPPDPDYDPNFPVPIVIRFCDEAKGKLRLSHDVWCTPSTSTASHPRPLLVGAHFHDGSGWKKIGATPNSDPQIGAEGRVYLYTVVDSCLSQSREAILVRHEVQDPYPYNH